MMSKILMGASALCFVASPALAGTFVNGGFETGTTTGWDVYSSAYRSDVSNPDLTPTFVKDHLGGDPHSEVISAGTIDPNVGAAFGSTVYSGNYSYRVEDTVSGGYASLIEQTVTNYTDANIFFAWKAVLEGAHGPDDAATMIITLRDLTTGTDLIRHDYNAADDGSGVNSIFSFDGDNYYTADWQIEQLSIGAGLAGHDFLLSVLASDCSPTGHWGYVYLDGFGAVSPPTTPGAVPEPASWAMMIGGLGLVGAQMRRRKTTLRFA